MDGSEPSSRAFNDKSGLLPIVAIEAAVFRLDSRALSGRGGGWLLLGTDVARPSQENGAVTLRVCGGCGDGALGSGERFGGPPQGTEGRAAESP